MRTRCCCCDRPPDQGLLRRGTSIPCPAKKGSTGDRRRTRTIPEVRPRLAAKGGALGLLSRGAYERGTLAGSYWWRGRLGGGDSPEDRLRRGGVSEPAGKLRAVRRDPADMRDMSADESRYRDTSSGVLACELKLDVGVEDLDACVASRVSVFGSQQILEVRVVSHDFGPPGRRGDRRRPCSSADCGGRRTGFCKSRFGSTRARSPGRRSRHR